MFRWQITGSFVAMLVCGMTAVAQSATEPPDHVPCDLSDSLSVHWQALGETVTLHTKVSQEGKGYPRAKLYIAFSNGKVLDLGDGGKYYDDYAPDNTPNCEHILAAATNSTVVSLNDDVSLWRPELYGKTSPYKALDIRVYRSMSDVRAELLLANVCNAEDEDYKAASKCQIAQHMAEQIADNESNLPKHEFDKLVSENAPIITVTRSTYYSQTYAYERKDNSLHELYFEGC